MKETTLKLSKLPKTWLIDVDGTLFVHNGHLQGEDQLVAGCKQFIDQIPATDTIILLTSRSEDYRQQTECALKRYGIRYDRLIVNLPVGERILVNDTKPQGLQTAIALNVTRNCFDGPTIDYSENR